MLLFGLLQRALRLFLPRRLFPRLLGRGPSRLGSPSLGGRIRASLACLGRRHRRVAHLGTLGLRHVGGAVRGHRGQSLDLLRRRQRGGRVTRHVGGHRRAARGRGRAGLDLRTQRGGQVRLMRHLGLERASVRGDACRRLHGDVRDVARVRHRVVGHPVVVDRRMARVAHRGTRDGHAHRENRRRADDDRRRRAEGRGNDEPRTRARRRRHEDARRSFGRRPDDDAGVHVGPGDGPLHRRRDELGIRGRPVSGDEDDALVAMLVVGLHPHVLLARRIHPAACAPDPVALPRPVAARPDRIGIGLRRRHLDQHRRRRPRNRHGLGFDDRRIDEQADDRAEVIEPARRRGVDVDVD